MTNELESLINQAGISISPLPEGYALFTLDIDPKTGFAYAVLQSEFEYLLEGLPKVLQDELLAREKKVPQATYKVAIGMDDRCLIADATATKRDVDQARKYRELYDPPNEFEFNLDGASSRIISRSGLFDTKSILHVGSKVMHLKSGLSLNDCMEEQLPLLKQKYELPRFPRGFY